MNLNGVKGAHFMNAKERLKGYVAGTPVDRRPNLTIVGSVVTQYTGIDLVTYCKDWRAMTESAVACARDLKLDYIQIASDLVREAEGFGSRIQFLTDNLPRVEEYVLKDIEDVKNLKPLRAEDVRRMVDLCQAATLAMELESDIDPMVLSVGPMTIAGNMRGVEDLMVDCFDDPEAVEDLLNLTCGLVESNIRMLASAGVRYIYVADPVASLVSPNMYASLVLPLHKRIYGLMDTLGITGRLHMCGDTTAILPYSSGCGAKIIDIDHAVRFPAAIKAAEGRCILNGNIDPVQDVYACTPEHTKAAILAAADSIGRARAMFMPGCELPTKTALENVRAIHAALCEIGG